MQEVFDQVRLESPLVTSKRLYARTNFSAAFLGNRPGAELSRNKKAPHGAGLFAD
jgi:hypothetical protein